MSVTTRERNYTRNPHTATFLQVFHSGISSTTGRNYRAEADDAAALAAEAAQDDDLLDLVTDTDTPDLRTEGQARFMDELIARITKLDAEVGAAARKWTDDATQAGHWTPGRDGNASAWIDRMLGKERELKAAAPVAPKTAEVVPNGRYAVEEDGTLKFFHVRNGKAGTRWAGFVFVDIQASDDLYALKDRARKAAVLASIAADLETASRRYGQELGVCGRCSKTLTDAESRAYGIGPVCRNK